MAEYPLLLRSHGNRRATAAPPGASIVLNLESLESRREYDRQKVDEMVVALLWLTLGGDGRAWKSHDWDALERLHERGYISDPKSKAKSVLLSEDGERRAQERFARHFEGKVECGSILRGEHFQVLLPVHPISFRQDFRGGAI